MAVGSGSRAAWPSNDDFTFLSLAVVVIGLAFFGWLGWSNYHADISALAAALFKWQIRLIHHFTPALDGLYRTIVAANFDAVTIPEILTAANLIGHYLRIPAIIVILVLAALCFTRAAPSQFVRKLDLEGLIREHTQHFGGWRRSPGAACSLYRCGPRRCGPPILRSIRMSGWHALHRPHRAARQLRVSPWTSARLWRHSPPNSDQCGVEFSTRKVMSGCSTLRLGSIWSSAAWKLRGFSIPSRRRCLPADRQKSPDLLCLMPYLRGWWTRLTRHSWQ